MTGIKQHIKLIVVEIILLLTIVSASYLWLNTIPHPAMSTQPQLTCTINQTQGETLVIDQSLNNAVICTKPGNHVILRLPLFARVGGVWSISNSTGLRVSDEKWEMSDPRIPGLGSNTIEWNVTTLSVGTHTLTAKCIQGVVGAGHEKIIATQNLTFVVQ
jgi:hypothetical protein